MRYDNHVTPPANLLMQFFYSDPYLNDFNVATFRPNWIETNPVYTTLF